MSKLVLNKQYIGKCLLFIIILLNGVGKSIEVFGINIVNILAVLLLVVTFLFSNAQIQICQYKQKRYLLYASLFWLIYVLIQSLWSVNFKYYIMGLGQTIGNIFLIMMLLYYINSIEDVKLFLNAGVSVLAIHVVLAFIEIFYGIHFNEASSFWQMNYVRTFYENPNECATVLFCGILLLMLKSSFSTVRAKVLLSLLMIASVVAVYYTGSRGVILGIVFSIILIFIYFIIEKVFPKSVIGIKLLCVFIIIAIFLSFLLFNTNALLNIIEKYSGVGNMQSDFYRVQIAKDTFSIFLNSYFLGVGPLQSTAIIGINPHNFILEVLADYGIFVALLIYGFLIKIFVGVVDSKYNNLLRSCFLIILPSVVIAGISSSSINKFRILWVMLTLAYLCKIYFIDEKHENMKK